jgi:hypothetical protein
VNERAVHAWARRLERVLKEAPPGIEALVTDSSIVIVQKGTRSAGLEAEDRGGVRYEQHVEDATIVRIPNGPALRPWSEAL